MSMSIGSSSSNTRVIHIKDLDGSTVGTISVSKPSQKKTKKKRLGYNFRKVSNQIVTSKTSSTARTAMSSARRASLVLKQKQRSSEYNENEVKNAIVHAKSMERIAKKRVKHMEEEERAKNGAACVFREDESGFDDMDQMKGKEQGTGVSEEELDEMLQQLEELMDRTMAQMEQISGLDELADALSFTAKEDMDPRELDRVKNKHRSDEMRQLTEANMRYLKALFMQYEKEKREGISENYSMQGDSNSDGISLQLSGMEIPIQTTEAPVTVQMQGLAIDVCL